MSSQEKLVIETMDRIANSILKSIFQELFYQDYSHCLTEHGRFDVGSLTFDVIRHDDVGGPDHYDYPWVITCLDKDQEIWQTEFNVVDNFSAQYGHDAIIDKFDLVEKKEQSMNDVMKQMIAFVVAVTTTYHPNGVKLNS